MRIVCQQTILMEYHALFLKKKAKFEIVVCDVLRVNWQVLPRISCLKHCCSYNRFFYNINIEEYSRSVVECSTREAKTKQTPIFH